MGAAGWVKIHLPDHYARVRDARLCSHVQIYGFETDVPRAPQVPAGGGRGIIVSALGRGLEPCGAIGAPASKATLGRCRPC